MIKKTTVLLLTFALLILSFTACINGNEGTEPPTEAEGDLVWNEELQNKIKQTHVDNLRTQKGSEDATLDDVQIVEYCGIYNNAVAVMLTARFYMHDSMVAHVTIADVTITYGNGNRLTIWKDGEFFGLQEAYDKGYITKQDIVQINYTHSGLTIELQEQIKQTHVDFLCTQPYSKDATLKDVTINDYYGTFNDAIAVTVTDKYSTYFGEVWSETVAEVEIIYNNSNYIRIWKNGEFYRLQKAYDNGYITKEDLIEIKHKNTPLFTKELSEKIEEAYVDYLITQKGITDATKEKATIDEYYGIYNNYVAVVPKDGMGLASKEPVQNETIAGVEMKYYIPYPIMLWKDGKIYRLQEAYDNGDLTQEDLIEIKYVYENIGWSMQSYIIH